MKISIVTAYYNRKKLFEKTLKSISLSKIKDIEVIAVDDGSAPEHRLESLVENFPFLKIIRLERENRWYINPCIPFNVGFKEASGEIIVIQNPECFHSGDILSHIIENMEENDYYTYSTYALNDNQTNALIMLNGDNIIGESKKIVMPYNPRVFYQVGIAGWYNHSQHRPAAFHFCSAIYRTKMKELNGFDERYSMGIAYDDDEFVVRIKRNKMNIKIIDDVTAYHQSHDKACYNYPNAHQLHEKNKDLLFNTTMKEDVVFVNDEPIIKK